MGTEKVLERLLSCWQSHRQVERLTAVRDSDCPPIDPGACVRVAPRCSGLVEWEREREIGEVKLHGAPVPRLKLRGRHEANQIVAWTECHHSVEMHAATKRAAHAGEAAEFKSRAVGWQILRRISPVGKTLDLSEARSFERNRSSFERAFAPRH